MVDPVITIWNSGDTAQYTEIDYGAIDAEQSTAETTINVWNDKGGGANSVTATAVTITTITTAGLLTGLDLVNDKWYNVKCTSFGDAVFTAVGGATTKAIGSAAGVQTIPKNAKAIVVTKNIVPSTATSGLRQYKVRVAYTFT